MGSDEGGHINATFVSLIANCQLHGIGPHASLRDLLCLLPGWNSQRVLALAPLHWAATSARPEVQAALAANIFRTASLA